MSLISQFLHYWRKRANEAADASAPTDWFSRVRFRIVSFLISRYSDERSAHREESLIGLVPRTLNTAMFDVQPVEARPRSRERIGTILHAIHQLNVDAWRARRWRWFL
jgi:hypothetical protein